MRIRPLSITLAGLSIAAVAFAACTGPSDHATGAAPKQGSDPAAAFSACLTSAGLEARINDTGQVLVKHGQAHPGDSFGSGADGSFGDTSGEPSRSEFGGDALVIESDETGSLWVAAADAAYFTDDPEAQDAYASCEQQHPEFSQPHPEPGQGQDLSADIEEKALAFSHCARENGFSQIADPETGGTIMIPEGFTESDFRALLDACYDSTAGFGFGTRGDLSFELWTVLDEYAEAGA